MSDDISYMHQHHHHLTNDVVEVYLLESRKDNEQFIVREFFDRLLEELDTLERFLVMQLLIPLFSSLILHYQRVISLFYFPMLTIVLTILVVHLD